MLLMNFWTKTNLTYGIQNQPIASQLLLETNKINLVSHSQFKYEKKPKNEEE